MIMTIMNQEAMDTRAGQLKANGLNGLDFILVNLHPAGNPTEARLEVHFHNHNSLGKIIEACSDQRGCARIFPISGGSRIRGGVLSGQVRTLTVNKDPHQKDVLFLTVAPIGDSSDYTLGVFFKGMDPLFSEVKFRFRPGCFSTCPPEWEKPPEPIHDPPIDYLAKDFESFKHTLVSWMMTRVPGWEPTSEADLDQVLIEVFSSAADELSDYQDRVMNEAYLGTARKRVSITRHARLMDYHVHQGNQASTWMILDIILPCLLDSGFQVWTDGEPEDDSTVMFMSRDHREPLFTISEPTFSGELDEGTIPAILRTTFARYGLQLSDNADIITGNPGRDWIIVDSTAHKIYQLIKEAYELNICDPHLHPIFNAMGLYTWNNSIPALAAGTTQADIKVSETGDIASAYLMESLIRDGGLSHLIIQQHLNPETGQSAGVDRKRRQVLTLLRGRQNREKRARAMIDPLTEQWFVRVQWEEEDALEHDYCFTVDCPDGRIEDITLFHGNLIRVFHGKPKETIFRDPSGDLASESEYHYERSKNNEVICRLPDPHLAYLNTPPGGEIPPQSTLEVEIRKDGSSDKWDEVISLVHSDDSDERGDHFLVETDEEGYSTLRFGNGINGRKVQDGGAVRCEYQTGLGTDGNVGSDILMKFDEKSYSHLINSLWNPFDVKNGRAPESVEMILRRAPEAYLYRQQRAVTLDDYIDRAQELSEVQRASASYAWTGSWRTVRLTIDPVGSTTLTRELKEKVAGHLDALRLLGEDLEIRGPEYVPLEIKVSLCLQNDFWSEDVLDILNTEFSEGYTSDGRKGFFHPDLWTFGQGLHMSQIIGRLQYIRGVDHVTKLSMDRWNDKTPGTPERIELRPNEIIRVKSDPDHREEGTIIFDLRGGRQ